MKASHSVIPVLSVAIIHMAGCAYTPAATSTAGQTADQPTSTNAATLYLTSMWTVTETPTITDTPTITATPTPPPDLELTDVTILPDLYTILDQNYSIMARLRNNTKTTMIMSDRIILKMSFDLWEFDSQGDIANRGPYFHMMDIGNVEVGETYFTNYIIYPGDEGTVAFNIFNLENNNYKEITAIKNFNGPLGLTYTYQSFYKLLPNLAAGFHAQAENATFQNEGKSIGFDFDIEVPVAPIFGVSTDVKYYIVFYGINNRIIDIMQKRMNDYSGFEFGKKLHIHDSTASAVFNELFLEMTSNMASQVDHLDIITEMTYGGMFANLNDQ